MENHLNSRSIWLSYVYLAISLFGAASTTICNIRFVNTYGPGFDVGKFISLASNNPASQSLSFDLFFLSLALICWMAIESSRLNIKYFWIIIASTLLIAIAFSVPLFLFLRERRIIEINIESL